MAAVAALRTVDLEPLTPPASLPTIVRALDLRDADVCNIWCGGARLWGCHTTESDYELYVVHRSADASLRNRTLELAAPAAIRATLVHVDEWERSLKMHNPMWLLFLSHPLPWMLRLEPSSFGFDVSNRALRGSMFAYSMREWSRVQKCFTQSPADVDGGRGALLHLLRTYSLITQLVTNRHIVDYAAAEPLRLELAQYDAAEWAWWKEAFEPRIQLCRCSLMVALEEMEAQVNQV